MYKASEVHQTTKPRERERKRARPQQGAKGSTRETSGRPTQYHRTYATCTTSNLNSREAREPTCDRSSPRASPDLYIDSGLDDEREKFPGQFKRVDAARYSPRSDALPCTNAHITFYV